MKCGKCGTLESRVKKTIIQVEELGFNFGELKQRKRECLSCRRPFYTYEIHESMFEKLQQLLGRGKLSEQKQPDTARPGDRRQLRSHESRGPLDFRRSIDDD